MLNTTNSTYENLPTPTREEYIFSGFIKGHYVNTITGEDYLLDHSASSDYIAVDY